MGETSSRSKLVELMQKSGLQVINEDMHDTLELLSEIKASSESFKEDLESAIKLLPNAISSEIDDKIAESVNKLIEAAEYSQEHVQELQKENTELLTKQLSKTQIDFVVAAKDSIDSMFAPQLGSMNSLIKQLGKAKGTSGLVYGGAAVFLLVVGLGLGVVGASAYYTKQVKQGEFYNSALYESQKAAYKVIDDDSKDKFEAEFNKNFARMVASRQTN